MMHCEIFTPIEQRRLCVQLCPFVSYLARLFYAGGVSISSITEKMNEWVSYFQDWSEKAQGTIWNVVEMLR